MAQFYTLDEAANRLGIPEDEFKRRLKLEWTSIRPFRDGATLRFRAADIDELARSLGAASDPGLPLGPVGSAPAEEDVGFNFAGTSSSKGGSDAPLNLSMDEPTNDDFALPLSEAPGKSGSDSDLRLELSPGRPSKDGDAAVPTEEISLDLSGPGGSGILKSGNSSLRLSASKSGTKLSNPEASKIPSPTSSPPDKSDSSSEFELSLDADSDSFELQMTSDSSEEVDLGSLDLASDRKGGQSGINLGKPSDSGVSLEKAGASDASDDDVDFELSLEPTGASSLKLGNSGKKIPPPKKPVDDDSSSEFELTLDDSSGVVESLAAEAGGSGKGDIFETDFELPVVQDESGSEVVEVDAADTDLENTGFEVDLNELDSPSEDESASQVVLVDDGDAQLLEEDPTGLEEDALVSDLEEGASASAALRGVRGDDEEAVGVGPVRTVVAQPAKWGPLPAIVLFICLVPAFLGMLMTFEILMGMRGYTQGGKPSGTLVRGVADMFGMKVTD